MPEYIIGRKPVMEALKSTYKGIDLVLVDRGRIRALENIVQEAGNAGISIRRVSSRELDRQCAGNHQGVAARVTQAQSVSLEKILSLLPDSPLPLILALDQVQDPGNVGSLARTLLALGGAGMVLPKNNSAHIGTGALKASAGAISRLPFSRITNMARTLEELKQEGFWIYGIQSADKAQSIYPARLQFPAIVLLGNEEKGIRPNVCKRCDVLLHIPMPGGFDSLNVAQAGAIALSEFLRKKFYT